MLRAHKEREAHTSRWRGGNLWWSCVRHVLRDTTNQAVVDRVLRASVAARGQAWSNSQTLWAARRSPQCADRRGAFKWTPGGWATASVRQQSGKSAVCAEP